MSAYLITMEQGRKVARPILTREEYLTLRNSSRQKANLSQARQGSRQAKMRLLQMNYSCIPNPDGTLRGSNTPSGSVGMDVDFDPQSPDYQELMRRAPQMILDKREQLGLLMAERSATKGYHIVFSRRPGLSNEENLKWASELLGVEFDKGAKDLTRVFFTTSAEKEDLIYLDDRLFEIEPHQNMEHTTPTTPHTTPTAETHTPAHTPATQATQPEYKGLPYSAIIDSWFARNGGMPIPGERNMRLYQLAAALRAICDNDQQLLLSIIPDCGLPEAELRSIVQSACREQPKGITKALQEAIADARLQQTDPPSPSADEPPENTPRQPSPTFHRLPPALRATLAGVPESMWWPVVAAVMPMAAAYADGVEAEYCDGTRQRLGLMSVILGDQASGKSVCKKAVDLWKRQLDAEDAEARRREDEWKAKKKARKANEKAPDDPQVLIRVVPVTVSCSTLLKRLKNSRLHTLYSFGEELDTLRKTNGAGSWSSKYDIYRLAFDNGEWGQDYNSDQAESGVVSVAYNWTMLGTYGAMRRCFKTDNIENGLSSRMIVADMPDNSFAPMPHYQRRTPHDEQLIAEGVEKLRSAAGFVDTPRLREAIAGWVEEKRLEAAKDIDHVKDTYRKRAAVIGFRCGVVCHLLSGAASEEKQTVDFALEVARLTLDGQIRTFGEQLEQQYASPGDNCRRKGRNTSLFDSLPPVFTKEDLRQMKADGCSDGALRSALSRWKLQHWIERCDRTHWRKIPDTQP